MAFVSPALTPEQENQFSPVGVTTPNPMAMLPPQAAETGGSAGSGTVGGGAPTQGTPTQFGSNASKLSDYLSANADQTNAMGNQIAGNMTGQFGQVQGDIAKAGQAGAAQIASGTPQYDPSLIGQFQQNPTDFASKPDNTAGFQKMFNASYTGPENFESTPTYSGIQNEVQGAVKNADLVNTYPGLSTYLQNNAKGTYTPGMNTLDTVLLQGNQPAYKAVTDAAKPYTGLNKYLSDTTGQVNAAVAQGQQTAQNTKNQTQAAYQGVASPFVGSLNKMFDSATKGSIDYNKQMNDISDKIANGKYAGLTPEEQSLIGYNPKVGPLMDQYPGIFPTQAESRPLNFAGNFTQGHQAQVPSAEKLMTPDKIAEYKALSQLSGSAPTGLNFNMPDAYDPIQGQTGSQPGVLPQFNNAQALAQIEDAYGPFYQQALGTGALTQQQISYMNDLRSAEGGSQPASQPTTPPPAPGTGGDLGAGFHWDQQNGVWAPTIPLQPAGATTTTTSGGGFHTF